MIDANEYSDGGPKADWERSTSSTLLDKAQQGDACAWRQMEVLYRPLVRWWCRRGGVPKCEDIEDLTQDVLGAVAHQIASFAKGPKGSFRAWLRGITRRKIADHFRRKKDPDPVGGDDAQARLNECPDEVPDPISDEEDASERTILIRSTLESIRREFQTRTWEAFWRVVMDEQCPADVASELGMKVGAVYVAKSRVLGRLREVFADLPL